MKTRQNLGKPFQKNGIHPKKKKKFFNENINRLLNV